MSDDAMKALDQIEAALKPFASVLRNNGELYEPDWITRDDCKSAARALSLLPTLRAALTPPADDEIEAIRNELARRAAVDDDGDIWERQWAERWLWDNRATLLKALDAERQRRVEVEGWQPIETAPKDGTPILACAAGSSFNDTSIVKWWKDDWVAMADGHYAILSAGDTWTDWIQPYVTHWRPLPAPPATITKETP